MANNLKLIGKVAQFPDDTKAVTALSFLNEIRANPKHIWYVVIEDQQNELKTVKYNRSVDLNLIEYTDGLKKYYLEKFKDSDNIIEQLNNITVTGEADFAVIKNIPNISIEEKTLISIIASDLIKLLSK
jgi:hypothetical protein